MSHLLLLTGQLSTSARLKLQSPVLSLLLSGSLLVGSPLEKRIVASLSKNKELSGIGLFGIDILTPKTGSPYG